MSSQSIQARDKGVLSSTSHDEWIADGFRMAQREPDTVFVSIEGKHGAEAMAHGVTMTNLRTDGQVLLQRRNHLEQSLAQLGFDPAQHARDLAQGRVDLAWAVTLTLLNAVLALFVLMGFGPIWLTIPLALLVLGTALTVEEFFQAYEEDATLRMGLFLVLAILSLGAMFWLGSVRGLFVSALMPADVGPASHALAIAGGILRHVLGILSIVVECMCGYKLHRVRAELFSKTARAVRERDRCNTRLVALTTAFKAAQVEPGIRRAFREIGARQYLASRAQTKMEPGLSHLGRAALGALVALVAIAVLLVLADVAVGAPATDRVILLLDLSKSTSAHAFQKNVQTVEAILGRTPAGAHVTVVGIADDFGRSSVFLDRTVPQDPGYLNLGLYGARERLSDEWRSVARKLSPTYARTDIMGALALLPHMGDLPRGHTIVIVFSDLRQSAGIDLERVPRIAVGQTLAKVQASIPTLKGARVYLLGVDPSGKSAAYFASLREFWTRFFAAAGAEVRAFSVGREFTEF